MGHLIPAGTGFDANRMGEMMKATPDPLALETSGDGDTEESNGEAE